MGGLRGGGLRPSICMVALSRKGRGRLRCCSSLLLGRRVFSGTSLFVIKVTGKCSNTLDLVREVTRRTCRGAKRIGLEGFLLSHRRRFRGGRVQDM